MKQYSIRQYFVWLTLVPLLFMAVSLESFFLHDRFTAMDDDLAERGQLIAHQLASGSEYGVFSNNQAFLQNIAQGVLQQPDVEGVVILDAASAVLIEAGEFSGRASKLKKLANSQMPVYRNGEGLQIYRAIIPAQVVLDDLYASHQAQQIGAVIVAMSSARTGQLKSRLLWLTMGSMALFLIFPLILIYLGNRNVVSPIGRLSDAVRAIGDGFLETRVSVSMQVTELETLKRGINYMAAKLQQENEILLQRTDKLTEAQRIAHLGNWEWDVVNNTLSWSDEIYHIFGLTPQQVNITYDVFMQAVHPEDRQSVEDCVREALEHGHPYSVDHRILLPDGSLRYVHQQGEVSRNYSGQPVKMLGTVLDITERKQAEQKVQSYVEELTRANAELHDLNAKLAQAQNQLVQSEKMASIGMLAAGVAHEINNPISFIKSNTQTLGKYVDELLQVVRVYEQVEALLPQHSELFAELQRIKKQIEFEYKKRDILALLAESNQGLERVTNIVRNLKDFSHMESQERWNMDDIHKGIESTLNVIWNELKYTCELKKEYGVLPPVECVLSQLNQVFMNLLVNASQAIESKGTITIRTGALEDQVWIEISDTGSGIPPENIKSIFDPFFTTKPVGKGTGLGLSVSYNIIQKHHGRIEVESEVGKGSTFRVWLPIRQPKTDTAIVPRRDGQ